MTSLDLYGVTVSNKPKSRNKHLATNHVTPFLEMLQHEVAHAQGLITVTHHHCGIQDLQGHPLIESIEVIA